MDQLEKLEKIDRKLLARLGQDKAFQMVRVPATSPPPPSPAPDPQAVTSPRRTASSAADNARTDDLPDIRAPSRGSSLLRRTYEVSLALTRGSVI